MNEDPHRGIIFKKSVRLLATFNDCKSNYAILSCDSIVTCYIYKGKKYMNIPVPGLLIC